MVVVAIIVTLLVITGVVVDALIMFCKDVDTAGMGLMHVPPYMVAVVGIEKTG